jgi:hypothetical protein
MFLVSNDLNWDVGNAASEGFGFIATFDSPAPTSLAKADVVRGGLHGGRREPSTRRKGSGAQNGTGAIGGFKVKGTSNLTAGKVRILGLA